MPVNELLAIDGPGRRHGRRVAQARCDALTTKALAKEESFEGVEPSEELLNLNGLGRDMAYAPGRARHRHPQDLAEQGIMTLPTSKG